MYEEPPNIPARVVSSQSLSPSPSLYFLFLYPSHSLLKTNKKKIQNIYNEKEVVKIYPPTEAEARNGADDNYDSANHNKNDEEGPNRVCYKKYKNMEEKGRGGEGREVEG